METKVKGKTSKVRSGSKKKTENVGNRAQLTNEHDYAVAKLLSSLSTAELVIT